LKKTTKNYQQNIMGNTIITKLCNSITTVCIVISTACSNHGEAYFCGIQPKRKLNFPCNLRLNEKPFDKHSRSSSWN